MDVLGAVRDVAAGFASSRAERQARRSLDRADFDALSRAGLLRTGLPVERGGLWRSVRESARPISEIFRALAAGDSSVALVSSMHPAVLAFWLATPEVPAPHEAAWRAQRERIFATVEAGAWWGTITSEPGSGGDVTRTTTRARRDGERWRLTGLKHFASGSGITSFMLTTALPEGERRPDSFFVPVAGAPEGLRMIAPWDGHGMAATQSHAYALEGCAAERSAWPDHLDDLIGGAGPFFATLFTAIALGIVETAVATAKAQLAQRPGLRPYEQVEWAQAELEAWTAEQAYEGVLRAIEAGKPARGAALRGKTIVAQLSESCLTRLCHVLGGGTYSRRSPFGHWFEDVRALGFLRPPWGLAFDNLIADTLAR